MASTSAITWPRWLPHLWSRRGAVQIVLPGTPERPPHTFAAGFSGLVLARGR